MKKYEAGLHVKRRYLMRLKRFKKPKMSNKERMIWKMWEKEKRSTLKNFFSRRVV